MENSCMYNRLIRFIQQAKTQYIFQNTFGSDRKAGRNLLWNAGT